MQNRCKTLLCSASKLRIYSRRQEQQFLQNGVVAMSFVSSSSLSGGVWGRSRVIRESFVDDDVAFQRGRLRSLCCHRCCGNNDNNNNSEKKRGRWNATTTTTYRRKFTSASSDENEQYSFAIVGSGPAGMYAADKLLHMKSNSSSSSSSSSSSIPVGESFSYSSFVSSKFFLAGKREIVCTISVKSGRSFGSVFQHLSVSSRTSSRTLSSGKISLRLSSMPTRNAMRKCTHFSKGMRPVAHSYTMLPNEKTSAFVEHG